MSLPRCSRSVTKAFDGLYTVMNEYGQIMQAQLVQTGGHAELSACISGLARRQQAQGAPAVCLCTVDDCCASRPLWLKSFPHLGSDVSECTADPADQLPQLQLPREFDRCTVYLSTPAAVSAFVGDLMLRKPAERCLIVGLDCEWTIGVPDKVDTLQLALSSGEVCVIHLCKLGPHIPNALTVFLSSPDVCKVGKSIDCDASRLLRAHSLVVTNCVDIARMARAANLISSARLGLDAMSRTLLSHKLAGKETTRLMRWDGELTDVQVEYAALDAYAGVLIYEKIAGFCAAPDQMPSLSDLSDGRRVYLLNQGGQKIAAIAEVVNQPQGEGVHVIVKVLRAIVPATKLPRQTTAEGLAAEGPASVGAAAHKGAPIDWHRRNVRVTPPEHQRAFDLAVQQFPPGFEFDDRQGRKCTVVEVTVRFDGLRVVCVSVSFRVAGRSSTAHIDVEQLRLQLHDCATPVQQPPAQPLSPPSSATAPPDTVATGSVHQAGTAVAQQGSGECDATQSWLPPNMALDAYEDRPDLEEGATVDHAGELDGTFWQATAGSWKANKIKLDAVHAMMRVERTLSSKHGVYAHFLSRFRDAVFVVDAAHLAELKLVLTNKKLAQLKRSWCRDHNGSTPNNAQAQSLLAAAQQEVNKKELEEYSYFLDRVRRQIPEPGILEARVRAVAAEFGNVEDAARGTQLFTRQTWKALDNLRGHIRRGCLSDSPDINYYYTISQSADGEAVLHCVRGTNRLEGFHHHLRDIAAQAHMSPRLFVAMLRSFLYRWNISRAVASGTLHARYGGWYCHEIVERVQLLARGSYGSARPYSDWISSNDFESTGETFFIPQGAGGPLNDAGRDNAAGVSETPAIAAGAGSFPPSLEFLARANGGLPTCRVADDGERQFYDDNYRAYVRAGGDAAYDSVDFAAFAAFWNEEAVKRDRDTRADSIMQQLPGRCKLYCKTALLLKQYCKELKERRNVALTLSQRAPANSGQSVRERNQHLKSTLRQQPSCVSIPQPFTPAPSRQCARTPALPNSAPHHSLNAQCEAQVLLSSALPGSQGTVNTEQPRVQQGMRCGGLCGDARCGLDGVRLCAEARSCQPRCAGADCGALCDGQSFSPSTQAEQLQVVHQPLLAPVTNVAAISRPAQPQPPPSTTFVPLPAQQLPLPIAQISHPRVTPAPQLQQQSTQHQAMQAMPQGQQQFHRSSAAVPAALNSMSAQLSTQPAPPTAPLHAPVALPRQCVYVGPTPGLFATVAASPGCPTWAIQSAQQPTPTINSRVHRRHQEQAGSSQQNPMCYRCGHVKVDGDGFHKKGVPKTSREYCTRPSSEYRTGDGGCTYPVQGYEFRG